MLSESMVLFIRRAKSSAPNNSSRGSVITFKGATRFFAHDNFTLVLPLAACAFVKDSSITL
jgi:hypothetical protein